MIEKRFVSPKEIADNYPVSEWCIAFWTRLPDRPLPCTKYQNGHLVIESEKFHAWYLLNVNQKTGRLRHTKHKRKKVQ